MAHGSLEFLGASFPRAAVYFCEMIDVDSKVRVWVILDILVKVQLCVEPDLEMCSKNIRHLQSTFW